MKPKSLVQRIALQVMGPANPREHQVAESAVLRAAWEALRAELSRSPDRVWSVILYPNTMEIYFHEEDWRVTILPKKDIVAAQAQIACKDMCAELGWPEGEVPRVHIRIAQADQTPVAQGRVSAKGRRIPDPDAYADDLVTGSLVTGAGPFTGDHPPQRSARPVAETAVALAWVQGGQEVRSRLPLGGPFGRAVPGSSVPVQVDPEVPGAAVVSRHALDFQVPDDNRPPRVRNRARFALWLSWEGGGREIGPDAEVTLPDRGCIRWPPDGEGNVFQLNVGVTGGAGVVMIEKAGVLFRYPMLPGMTELAVDEDPSLQLGIDASSLVSRGRLGLHGRGDFKFMLGAQEVTFLHWLVSSAEVVTAGQWPLILRFELRSSSHGNR